MFHRRNVSDKCHAYALAGCDAISPAPTTDCSMKVATHNWKLFWTIHRVIHIRRIFTGARVFFHVRDGQAS
jgi:hypothetical protein